MQKLKLDLDALDVVSFDLTPEGSETRGTVEAHSHTPHSYLAFWLMTYLF